MTADFASSKSFLASKTVWGGLVVIVVQVLTILDLDPAAIADTGEWLTNLVTLAAAGFAIYGRLAATKRVEPPLITETRVSVLLCAVGLMLALSSLACSPTAPYVAADRATYNAIAPEYSRYVEADPTLDTEDRALRQSTLATWDLRIRGAEKAR